MLTYTRDASEEKIYRDSLVNPEKRYIISETGQYISFYLNGIKHGAMKEYKTIKEKPIKWPELNPFEKNLLDEWNSNSQVSFDFMHPWEINKLRVRPWIHNLSFLNKQLELSI